jgi:hypothetical protein
VSSKIDYPHNSPLAKHHSAVTTTAWNRHR